MATTSVQSNNVAVKYRGKGMREMPLESGSGRKTISSNIEELHTGKTFKRTKKKFGKKRANKQAIAIALNEARKSGHAKMRDAVRRGLVSEDSVKKRMGA